MSRMAFVGNKDDAYLGELPATIHHPKLVVAEFQAVFHFLSNETEIGILHNLTLARITVNSELLELMNTHGTLDHASEYWFGDTDTGNALYKQAVFSLATNYIVGNKLSMDATAEAAERQDALQQKADNALVHYRRAVDLLLHGKETYTFEVV